MNMPILEKSTRFFKKHPIFAATLFAYGVIFLVESFKTKNVNPEYHVKKEFFRKEKIRKRRINFYNTLRMNNKKLKYIINDYERKIKRIGNENFPLSEKQRDEYYLKHPLSILAPKPHDPKIRKYHLRKVEQRFIDILSTISNDDFLPHLDYFEKRMGEHLYNSVKGSYIKAKKIEKQICSKPDTDVSCYYNNF